MTTFSPTACLLRSGHLWDPYAPSPADIHGVDFPTLARIPRWGGATTTAYVVAEHCIRGTVELMRRGASRAVQLAFHTHDLHEYLPPFDVPGPVLRGDTAVAAAFREMERGARNAVRTAIGLPLVYPAEVDEMDRIMLATERRDLMPMHDAILFRGLPEPLADVIRPVSQDDAEREWMALYKHIGGVLP